MIKNKDRAGYIGASDTKFVTGNWTTKTWDKWWQEKLGLRKNNFENKYTKAGNEYEHKILEALNIPNLEMDKQFIDEELKLRVNLDGNTENCIYEVKTYKIENQFKIPKAYIEQVQVQMYASGIKRAYIVSYGLTQGDYNNYFNPIDKRRLGKHKIKYDKKFIKKYLESLKVLADAIERGVFPSGKK